jgi:hypothetical protein
MEANIKSRKNRPVSDAEVSAVIAVARAHSDNLDDQIRVCAEFIVGRHRH